MATATASQQAAIERSALIDAQLAQRRSQFRVLTGDRPTGPLHLGHYLGTLRNRVRLQELGVEILVLIADYQVITDRDAGNGLGSSVRGLVADYLAAGIDPESSVIFTHSAIPALNQLLLPFLSLVSDAELRRNPTVKEETAVTGTVPNALMLTYPVHQAADILSCRANLVPVGLDQLPHVELARSIARRFNDRYSASSPVFPMPDALLTSTPMLMGLDGTKMSKSRGNAIALGASPDETAVLIRRAVTDSERHITYEPHRRPAVAGLLDLLAAATGDDPHQLAERIGPAGAAGLKRVLADSVNDLLGPLRQRRQALLRDPGQLDEILDAGNARSRRLADQTLTLVHERMGMAYANRS